MTPYTTLAKPLLVLPEAAAGALTRNRLLMGLVSVHFVITMIAGSLSGVPYNPGTMAALSELFIGLLPIFFAIFVIGRYVRMVRLVRPERPLPWLVADVRAILSEPNRVADGLVTLGILAVFTGDFAYFKEIIPHLVPYSWDPVFADMGRVLAGGVPSYVVLMHFFGNPYVVSAFNLVYQSWFFVMFFMVFLAAFSTGDKMSRNTFLVGFVLTWGIGGNFLATLLSSAGPIYYARLGFGHQYDALGTTLAAFGQVSPNWSLNVQRMLWEGYLGMGDVRGISAMPSMHVASTTLLMAYGYRRNRAIGVALTAFWTAICIAAMILGWHYAVDVYAGVACGLGGWWLAAKLTGDRAFPRSRARLAAL
jgi:hypothetical protein